MRDNRRKNRWYFGGLASACSVAVTHPLDLIKVHMQTQKSQGSVLQRGKKIYARDGIRGFYNGLSASISRQLIYATTRFGIYELGKSNLNITTLGQSIALGAFSGMVGGFIGSPCDIVNIRMQNDIALHPDKRRNYKNLFNGIYRIVSEEGLRSLYNGVSLSVARGAILNTIQVIVYDKLKSSLLRRPHFQDDMKTHFLASTCTVMFAMIVTQPFDVIKTRVMIADSAESAAIIRDLMKGAPFSLYKGIVPTFLRVGPQTILTFLIMEQLRLHYGYLPPSTNTTKE